MSYDYNDPRNNRIIIENTRFIYRTNFAGLPDEKYGSTTRYGNILIPDPDLAQELADEGFKVKETKPRPGEEEGFEPKYFTRIIVNYNTDVAKRTPPRIYLVERNGIRELLNEDNVGIIDGIYVLNVKVTLEKYNKDGQHRLYIKVMYVDHDDLDDPWAQDYIAAGQPEEDED